MRSFKAMQELENVCSGVYKIYLPVLLTSTKDYKKLKKWLMRIEAEGVTCLPTSGKLKNDPMILALKLVTILKYFPDTHYQVNSFERLWKTFKADTNYWENLCDT